MATISIKDKDFIINQSYKAKSIIWQIPVQDIKELKVIERSSFYHPIIGAVVGILSLSFALYFIVIGILNHWPLVLFVVPRGGLIWVPLFIGILTLSYLFKSKKIPWIILHSSQDKMKIPVDTMSFSEAKSFIDEVNRTRYST